MAQKKKYGKGKKRRTTSRRVLKKPYRQHNVVSLAYPQTRLGFPRQQKTKMKYVDSFVLDIGVAGAIAKHAFRANSIYDPDYTGTGHQPMMHDLWLQLYNHYVVTGSRITLRVYDSSPVNTTPKLLGIMLNDDLTTPSTWSEVLEQGTTKYTIVNPGNPNKVPAVSCNYSARKFFNVTDIKDNVNRIGAAQGNNPSDEAYFTCFALPYDQTSDLGAFRVLVTIEYAVDFSEPKDQAGS